MNTSLKFKLRFDETKWVKINTPAAYTDIEDIGK